MKFGPFLTTSWDDGHPLDLRIAEMLTRHGIAGTFYIPQQAETPVMSGWQLRELATSFEIGAHTLSHTVLTEVPARRAWQEIVGSKSWVEDQTGAACHMFCPPLGRYSVAHLRMVQSAGFVGLRSVELMSLDRPRRHVDLEVMPTSVQAHSHWPGAYLRNIAKRGALRNLWLYVLRGHASDWTAMACNLLDHLALSGGVFHLWGHSWELEQTDQWERLDDVLRLMASYAAWMSCAENGEICQLARGEAARGEIGC